MFRAGADTRLLDMRELGGSVVGTHLRTVLCAVTLAVATSGCTDKLTAPQAEGMLHHLEALIQGPMMGDEFPTGVCNENCIDRTSEYGPVVLLMGGWELPAVRFFERAQRVSLKVNGVPRSHSAFVIERIVMPEPVIARARECAGSKSALALWNNGTRVEGLVMWGGRFDIGLRFPEPCVEGGMRPEPSAIASPRAGDPDRNSFASRSGNGSISGGVPIGSCVFLADDAISWLERKGITCEMTVHTVSLKATLSRMNRWDDASSEQRFELSPVQLYGVRYTIDCHKSLQYDDWCQLRKRWNADEALEIRGTP